MKRIKLLQDNGIRPVVVFDGGCPTHTGNLPMKLKTEQQRKQSRQQRMMKGKEHVQAGNLTKATECFQSAVDITPAMALEFIKVF
jgi:5'-3' exonuclease